MIKELIKILEDNKEIFNLVVFIGGFCLIGFIGLLIWLLGLYNVRF